MIIGVGCDIIEIERIKKAIQKDSFVRRVFAVCEIEYCSSRNKQAVASFAARFAAKEAVLKAFGTGFRGGSLTDVILLNDKLGKPYIKLGGYYAELAQKLNVKNIHISISHSNENAMAYVVMEDEK